MKKTNYSMPFYTQPILIAIVFAFVFFHWAFAVLGIVLLILYYIHRKKVVDFYKKVDDIDKYSESVKSEAEAYKTKMYAESKRYYENTCDVANKKRQELDSIIAQNEQKINAYKTHINDLKNDVEAKKAELESTEKEIIVADSAVYVDFDITSAEYKDKYSMAQLKEKEIINNDLAVKISSEAPKSVINANVKQILRCFNSETSTIIKSVTLKNLDSLRSRLIKSYEMLNKIYKVDGVELTDKILEIKLEQLNLLYSYEIMKENEKEEQKAIREQMLEEEKVRREIEREKAKLDKEESQFKKEIDKLMSYLHKADDIEKQLYVDKIKELEEKLKLLEKDRDNVLEREQNTRAGFVYIISNIGSFGENIYKIGMTRRLEPMDRIKELSSASVPFEFDVHAMIFSEDAPKLENALHNQFDDRRVNKVNTRKEFFNVTLPEIEKVVKENHNATVTFTQIALAEQYRQSLKIIESSK